MLTALRIALISAAVAAFLLLAVLWTSRLAPDSWVGRQFAGAPQPSIPGETVGPQLARLSIGGPFTLVDQSGRTVTPASYGGRWLLIYFGYTTCPDVCPTTLQTMGAALDHLGAKARHVAPLFITVDPGRDRADVMARYTALFGHGIVGLTGSPAQIASVEKSFRVYAARVDQPGSGTYLMDHTSFIYLIDPHGALRALFDRDATAASIAARLDRVVS